MLQTFGEMPPIVLDKTQNKLRSRSIRMFPDRGLRRRLPRIACPTLVVFGADDAVVSSRYADDFKAGLRDGRTAVVAGAGHMLPYEQPARVLSLIESFLR